MGGRVAALILLAFGLLWLILFGVFGSSASLIQGICALLGMVVIVSRLRLTPAVLGALSLMILLAPLIPAGTPAPPPDPNFAKHVQQMALPQPLRDRQEEPFVFACHSRGYQDPPVLKKELAERQARVREWIQGHQSQIPSLLKPMDMPPPAAQVQERAVNGLAKDSFGEEWRWLPGFLERAREAGMDDGLKPLSEKDRSEAEAYAAAWLKENPEPQAMIPADAGLPDPEDQFRSAKRGSGVWLALLVLAPVWYSIHKDLGQLDRAWGEVPVLEGLRGLFHSPLRAVAGLVVIAGGVVLMVTFPSFRKVFMALSLSVGGSLLLSGLNLG